MNFNTDKQTLDDLNILARAGSKSVFNLYNNTRTRGGAAILEQMFLYPLSDQHAINERSRTIAFFSSAGMPFPFSPGDLDAAEVYLSVTDERTMVSAGSNTVSRKFAELVSADGDYKVVYNGIISLITIIQQMWKTLEEIEERVHETPYKVCYDELKGLLSDEYLFPLVSSDLRRKLAFERVAGLDRLLRFLKRQRINRMLSLIYDLDVYLSVAALAGKSGFSFAHALPKDHQELRIRDFFHPLVKNAVPNSIYINSMSNLVFLTGANMAGKSTFMKSVGIALYLAHMGFPIPALEMEFSVRDGMYTTINLPDDLSSGNSHFYAEVLRLKKVAKELSSGKHLFVVFDELFRGTNVKDAYEGTIAVTRAFSKRGNCMFIVSTHIVEAGEVLKLSVSNMQCLYLPTEMDGNAPHYPYKVRQGITADRHGMVIINNERILEIIRSRCNKK